jgi:hypothetical protein
VDLIRPPTRRGWGWRLPQSSYDRLKAACEDILLWEHVDPDIYLSYEAVPDAEFWEGAKA